MPLVSTSTGETVFLSEAVSKSDPAGARSNGLLSLVFALLSEGVSVTGCVGAGIWFSALVFPVSVCWAAVEPCDMLA